MLHLVCKKRAALSATELAIYRLFCEGKILARTIRGLDGFLVTPDTSALRTELASHEAAKNSNHRGGHFSTTLILHDHPIELYRHKIGFLFNLNQVGIRRFLLSDAYDDSGHVKQGVECCATYDDFFEKINAMTPSSDKGLIEMNEVQAYLSAVSRVAIFVAINAVKFAESDVDTSSADNIFAYLKAVAIHRVLDRIFEINLPIFLYDQHTGNLLSVTSTPSADILKRYIRKLNFDSYSKLDLDSTNRSTLEKINRKLSAGLGLIWSSDREFNNLIEDSLNTSTQNMIIQVKKNFHDTILGVGLPSSIKLLYSSTEKLYMITVPIACTQLVKKRISTMLEKNELTCVENKQRGTYDIGLLTLDQIKIVQDYFLYKESATLRAEASDPAPRKLPRP